MTPNLQLIHAPEGIIKGADIAYSATWTGNRHRYPGNTHFLAHPNGSHLFVRKRLDRPLVIGQRAGHVIFEGFTIHTGRTQAVLVAPENWRTNSPICPHLKFKSCTFVESDPARKRARWAMSGYHFDLEVEDCDFWGEELDEHCIYQRNSGPMGTRIKHTRFHGAGGECVKIVARPAPQYYPPDHPLHNYPSNNDLGHPMPGADTVITHSTFEHWGRRPDVNNPDEDPSSVPQGGGVVVQGAARNTVIEDSLFFMDQVGDGPALGVDDGGQRHFGWKTKIGGATPANGLFGVNRCIFSGYGPRSMIYVGGDPQNKTKEIVAGIKFVDSGFYGDGTRIDIQPPNKYKFQRCNTAKVEKVARALGIDTTHPTPLPR